MNATGGLLMSGSLEFFEQLGSHHALPGQTTICEPCNAKGHVEGWLTLCGKRALPGSRLHAILAGSLFSSNLSTRLTANIDGAVLAK